MFDIYKKYLISNFLKKFLYLSLVFFFLIVILGILEEITFFKNSKVSFWYPYFLTFLNTPITLFELFPFIFLLSSQFLFYDLSKKRELIFLKINGVNNFKIIKILFLLSITIGLFNIFVYYNIASKFKFQYSMLKNKHSDDNKYLAMVTESGLWIKDEINNKTLITKSKLIKGQFLYENIINEFNQDFQLIRTIQSNKIQIKSKNWIIYEPITTKNNVINKTDNIILKTNFNQEKINNFFSNISTLNINKLFNLIQDYEKIGYSTNDIELQLLKLFTTPIFYGILTILSAIIMLNINNERPIIFHIVIGILLTVIIYYFNFMFASLASSGIIPVNASIFFPILILSLFVIIGLVDINEK